MANVAKIISKVIKATSKKPVKKLAEPSKNSVVKKPARKPVGNPPNDVKAWEDYIGSVSRGALGRGSSAGKAKATRVANSKITKKAVPKANEPSRIPEIPGRETIKINSAKPTKPKPRTTAPKTDLSGRGAKLTPKEKAKRASDLNFGKMEQRFDRSSEMRSTGLVSSRKGLVAARGAGKKNQRKADAIKKEATKENFYERIRNPIKINTNPTKPK